MNYKIYFIFKRLKNNFYLCFLKNLNYYLKKLKINLFKITDFGEIICFKKKFSRFICIEIYCYENILNKIKKIFKIKKNNFFYIILKKNIFEKIKRINFFLSQNFLILPSILNKISYNKYNKISKIIKILKIFSIIPNNINNYIKKINLFL